MVSRGAINLDIHYTQLLLTLYLIWFCRRHGFPSCRVGSQRNRWSRFDDIFLEFTHKEKCFVYLFDIKQSRYKNRSISYAELTDPIGDNSLIKYFRTFLRLKEEFTETKYQLAVCSHDGFKKYDFEKHPILERVVTVLEGPDLLDGDLRVIRRYRLKDFSSFEGILQKFTHPLYELAEIVSCCLFEKKTVKIGKSFTKHNYAALLRDVFESNGFRREFLSDSKDLPAEAKQFRKYLEEALNVLFLRENICDFQLANIEALKFSPYIQVSLVSLSEQDTLNASWHIPNVIVTKADIVDFFSVLTFYTSLPNCRELRKKVGKHVDEETQNAFAEFYRVRDILNKQQIDGIFELTELRRINYYDERYDLPWELDAFTMLEVALRALSRKKIMTVEAPLSVKITLARIRRILSKFWKSSNYLTLTGMSIEDQLRKSTNLESCLDLDEDFFLVVDCTVCTDFSLLKRFENLNCKVVLVVENFIPDLCGDRFEDRFDFSDLALTFKDRLLSKTVTVDGRQFSLQSLLGENCFKTISAKALLVWEKCDEIKFESNAYNYATENFIDRTVGSETGDLIDVCRSQLSSVTVLSGHTGTGKSVILRRMAEAYTEKYKDCITILRNCESIISFLRNTNDVVDLVLRILDAKKVDEMQEFLVRKLVAGKRINLFIDEFDEIRELNIEETKTMLTWIHSRPIGLIVITTRPNKLPFLRSYLHDIMVLNIRSFTETDLATYLERRWSRFREKDQLFVLFHNFRKFFEDDSDFLRNPLQIKIITSIFEERLPQHNSSMIHYRDVAEVFRTLVDKHFSVIFKRVFQPSNKFHEMAVKSLRGSLETEYAELAFALRYGDIVNDEKYKELECYGLLRMRNKELAFIDNSFLEFFLASFFINYNVQQNHFNQFMETIFDEKPNNLLRIFLEYQISKADSKKALLGVPFKVDSNNLEHFRIRFDQKLHIDKTKQFYIYFNRDCSDEQVLNYIVDCVNREELNIFEVIYDSLSTSSYIKLSFGFTIDKSRKAAVDLSNVDENTLISLLIILIKKHPQHIIEKVLTDFTLTEPDYITTAIERNYQHLLEQLLYINHNLTDENEMDVLRDYFEQRWREYLLLVLRNQRTSMLETVFGCIGRKYHPKELKSFLLETYFIHVLADVCENVESTALETVEMLLDFAENYLSEYDLRVIVERVFDGRNYGNIVGKIDSVSIRALFERYSPFTSS